MFLIVNPDHACTGTSARFWKMWGGKLKCSNLLASRLTQSPHGRSSVKYSWCQRSFSSRRKYVRVNSPIFGHLDLQGFSFLGLYQGCRAWWLSCSSRLSTERCLLLIVRIYNAKSKLRFLYVVQFQNTESRTVSEGEGFSQSEAAWVPADQSDGRFPLID